MDEQEQALRARAEAQIGTTLIGKYRLDRVLGIGGMATVFAATHRNQAELAVKILHHELGLREDLKKRFLREGYVANSVKHPGAVMVVDDAIAEDGSAFLVMELLRGCTLEAIWEDSGRRMPPQAVTTLAVELLEVLAAAHEKAIVHRDLKPANLFVTTDGSLKVLDFGIARVRDVASGGERATRTGVLMGTPAFMAPEQAQAMAAEIDGQTDLWAVGATMFTLLTGELVHGGGNGPQLLMQAGTSRARSIASVFPELEPAIAAVVDRALVFEKAARWPSAVKMREALVSAATECFGAPRSRDMLLQLLPAAPRMSHRFTAETQPPADSMELSRTPVLARDGAKGSGVTPPTQGSPGLRGMLPPTPSGSPAPLQGTTTGSPVSGNPLPSVAARSPLGGKLVTGGAIAVAIAALVFAFQNRATTGVVAKSPATGMTPTLPTTSGTSAPLPLAPAPSPSTSSVVSAAAPTKVTATPATLSSLDVPADAPVKPKPKPAEGVPKPAAKLGAPPAHDCAITPYWYDQKGDKHWYPECQQ